MDIIIDKTIPWVEKYRPKNLNDIVLDPYNKILLENMIEKEYFPNMLLYGPPGTGKTTTIINLINTFLLVEQCATTSQLLDKSFSTNLMPISELAPKIKTFFNIYVFDFQISM